MTLLRCTAHMSFFLMLLASLHAGCNATVNPGPSSGSSGAGSSGGTGNTGGTGGDSNPAPTGAPFDGQATFYDANGTGSCSFQASPQDLDVAALSAQNYGLATYCGTCARITGPKGQLTVRIIDKCPECPAGNLDLSASAFAKIAEPDLGRVPIRWSVVPCTVQGPISYVTKDGTSKYWTAIQVRNHKVAITKVEMEKAGVFVNAARTDYNYFILANGVGADGSFRIRVTAATGEVLTDTLPGPKDKAVFQGAANFK